MHSIIRCWKTQPLFAGSGYADLSRRRSTTSGLAPHQSTPKALNASLQRQHQTPTKRVIPGFEAPCCWPTRRQPPRARAAPLRNFADGQARSRSLSPIRRPTVPRLLAMLMAGLDAIQNKILRAIRCTRILRPAAGELRRFRRRVLAAEARTGLDADATLLTNGGVFPRRPDRHYMELKLGRALRPGTPALARRVKMYSFGLIDPFVSKSMLLARCMSGPSLFETSAALSPLPRLGEEGRCGKRMVVAPSPNSPLSGGGICSKVRNDWLDGRRDGV